MHIKATRQCGIHGKSPLKGGGFFKGSRSFQHRKKNEHLYFMEDISMDESLHIRGFGRTIFMPGALEYMTREYIYEKTGEVDLLKNFQALGNGFLLLWITLKGKPCDFGAWEGNNYQPIFLKFYGKQK